MPRSVSWLTLLILFPLAGLAPAAEEYPVSALLPKEETGALRFLRKHPQFDGRGVTVAIFDTGVDPGAPGLQVTSDGKPKIVDVVDGTGDGDVVTTTKQKPSDGKLTGLTGRTLALPAGWKNPSGEYRLGIKRAYDFFPGELIGRLKSRARERWNVAQRKQRRELAEKIADFEAEHKKPNEEEQRQLEELQAQLKLLDTLQGAYDDPGPIYDCVLFHDGARWQAVIDTDEDGELGDEKLLTNYRDGRRWATFGEEDLLNFAVNIYDDGDLLSIVADCGAHGTHVAGIVAANYPDRPEWNGVAPGAQIVAVKIGDSRLGSSSAGTGPIRGMVAVLENKCDLINMSYGGASPWPNQGRIVDLYSELVNEHGVIFVASAGNNGPALSTVGSPGGTTSALIGVGAYVTPDLAKAGHAVRDELPEQPYTWTSRGPTLDGALGVDICAPGGAIAPVPRWTLQPNMLMNGTSMSSPNACGNIALLLSGLKQEELKYTPYSVRRALENTARPLLDGDPFTHGQGLIQTDAAYAALTEHADAVGDLLRFEATLPSREGDRGIYLREPRELDLPTETTVSVEPVFRKQDPSRDRADFEMTLAIETTADWVAAPEYLPLTSGGGRLTIRVDPTELAGGPHYAEVQGFDSENRDRGPLFRLPITVIRPEKVGGGDWQRTLAFEPGKLQRNFLAVPDGATWADLTIVPKSTDGPRLLAIQALQLLPRAAETEHKYEQYILLRPGDQVVRSFPVVGGRTLELAVAQYWSSLGEGDFDFQLSFHGLRPDDDAVEIDGSALVTRVEVAAPLRKERLSPSASLTTWRRTIRPSDAEIRPLGERDRLFDQRQVQELVLTYKFSLDGDATVTLHPALSRLDESWAEMESMMWAVYDEGKRRVATGSWRPTRLKKGDYVLKYHVRHESEKLLKKLEDTPLSLEQRLSSPIAVPVLQNPTGTLTGGGGWPAVKLDPGARAAFYLKTPAAPKSASPGDLLVGEFRLGQQEDGLPGAGRRPEAYPLTMTVPPAPTPKKSDDKSGGEKSKEEKPTLEEKFREQLRDLKLKQLVELRAAKDKEEAYEELFAELLEEWPEHLPLLFERLKQAETRRDENPAGVIAAADAIVALIDQDALAQHYGRRLDPEDKEAAKTRAEMDQSKQQLLEALAAKLKAAHAWESALAKDEEAARLADLSRSLAELWEVDPIYPTFEEVLDEIEVWEDPTAGTKYTEMFLEREQRIGRLAKTHELLEKLISEKPFDKKLRQRQRDLIRELGWDRWGGYLDRWLLIRFPDDYAPF